MDIPLTFLSIFLLSAAGGCTAQEALPPDPLKGEVGKNVTFSVLPMPAGVTFLTITWTFNGGFGLKPVITSVPSGQNSGEGYIGRAMVNKTTGSLLLSQLALSDTGEYTVNMVTDSGQTKTGLTKLKVYAPVSDVAVTSNTTNPVEFNSTVSLTCSASGSTLSFQWLNGTNVITPSDRLLLSDGNSTLTISNVLRNDRGPLYCTAYNALMRLTSQSYTLNISSGPDNVVLTTSPQKNLYRTGSNLTLSCSAESSPPALFYWFINGSDIKQMGQELKLVNIQEKESGNYTCQAFNSKTLRYKSSGSAQITILAGISESAIIGPTTPLIAGNSSVNLTCQATTGTVNSREWLKDGKTLSPSNRLAFSEDGRSMSIQPVQSSDNGEYLCKLTNLVNTDSASYKLTVNYGPEKATIAGKNKVEVGDHVELKCSVQSMPNASFNWLFNGTQKNIKTNVYNIDKVLYGDTGIYTCEAYNAVTGLKDSTNHTLVVKAEGTLEEPLSGGAIAGIVIGVLVAVGVIVCLGMRCSKKRGNIESPY